MLNQGIHIHEIPLAFHAVRLMGPRDEVIPDRISGLEPSPLTAGAGV